MERSALHAERRRLGLGGEGEPDFGSGVYATSGFATWRGKRALKHFFFKRIQTFLDTYIISYISFICIRDMHRYIDIDTEKSFSEVTFCQRRDAEIALRMQYRAHGLQTRVRSGDVARLSEGGDSFFQVFFFFFGGTT